MKSANDNGDMIPLDFTMEIDQNGKNLFTYKQNDFKILMIFYYFYSIF